MIEETWESEGPRRIAVRFGSDDTGQIIFMTVINHHKDSTLLAMDKQEFKSMLKAGLRFDEAIS